MQRKEKAAQSKESAVSTLIIIIVILLDIKKLLIYVGFHCCVILSGAATDQGQALLSENSSPMVHPGIAAVSPQLAVCCVSRKC